MIFQKMGKYWKKAFNYWVNENLRKDWDIPLIP